MKKAILLVSIAVLVAAVTDCTGTSLFPKILARTDAGCDSSYSGCFGDNFYEAITANDNNIWLGGLVQ